jgi:hypothetical protein
VKASADTLPVSLTPPLERAPKCLCLVGTDTLDEVHQRGLPAAGILGLCQRIHHEPGHQLVAAMHGRVPVGPVVANLGDEILLGQPLQHGHHRRVSKVASRRQCFVDLADGLRVWHRPQMIHYGAFQIP